MAAAAAVVCPCFSSASTTTTNARLPRYEAAPRMLTRTRLPRTRATAIGLSVWSPRSPKISVGVTQEEAAAAEVEVEEVEEGTVAEGGEEVEEEKQWKLYFGNLPYHCGSAQLAGIIQEFGSPEMVEVLYDRETGRSRGFAFVTMSSMEDAEAVIQNLDGREFGGRTLRVNFSDKPRPKEPLYPETEFKLFVGNLSWTVTSEILAQAFQEYGNIVGARVLYDGDTGRSRGYGFVCYSSRLEMEAALISLNGMVLEGRAMRVSLAMGKKS